MHKTKLLLIIIMILLLTGCSYPANYKEVYEYATIDNAQCYYVGEENGFQGFVNFSILNNDRMREKLIEDGYSGDAENISPGGIMNLGILFALKINENGKLSESKMYYPIVNIFGSVKSGYYDQYGYGTTTNISKYNINLDDIRNNYFNGCPKYIYGTIDYDSTLADDNYAFITNNMNEAKNGYNYFDGDADDKFWGRLVSRDEYLGVTGICKDGEECVGEVGS